MKRYTSFDQIDRDLKYLRLKSQVDFEQVKMGIHDTQTTFKESLSPMNLIGGLVGAVVKKAFLLKVFNKVVKMAVSRL